MRLHLPPACVEPRDLEALERRARELAAGAVEGPAAERLLAVAFRLGATPCAVHLGAVARAVPRLGRVAAVPLAEGTERAIAFVEEVPVQVLDLARALGRPSRALDVLERSPALVVSTAMGSVALAVEGPLELLEEELAGVAAAEASVPDAPLVQGRLRGGASLLDSGWLLGWANRSLGS